MDSRAKQRLTGAVILVALFVLLVPELLTGPKDTPAAGGTPDEDGLRRYTIDLEAPAGAGSTAAPDTVVTLPPVAETPVAAPMGGTDQALAQPGESAAPEPTVSQPQNSQPQAVRPGTSAATNPVTNRPAPQAAPRPVSPATQAPVSTAAPAPATAQTAPGADTRKPTASTGGTFVVQLGSFSNRANADKLVRDMTARGFATFIAPITTTGRELYRVRVGPTRDRASAEALATQLKRMGQSGSIVPIP